MTSQAALRSLAQALSSPAQMADLCQILRAMGEDELRGDVEKRILDATPETSRDMVVQARLRRSRKDAGVMDDLAQWLDSKPYDGPVWVVFGSIARSEGNLDEMRRACRGLRNSLEVGGLAAAQVRLLHALAISVGGLEYAEALPFLTRRLEELPLGCMEVLTATSVNFAGRDEVCRRCLQRLEEGRVVANDVQAIVAFAQRCSPTLRREATQIARRWAEKNEDSHAARETLVPLLLARDRSPTEIATATEETMNWLGRHPDAAGVWVAMIAGVTRLDRQKGSALAREARAKNPENPNIAGYAIDGQIEAGPPTDDVQEEVEKWLSKYPNDPAWQRRLAILLGASSRFGVDHKPRRPDESDRLFRELLARSDLPDDVRFLCAEKFADHLAHTARASEAIGVVTRHLPERLTAAHAPLLIRRAKARQWLSRDGDQELREVAKADYRKALELARSANPGKIGWEVDFASFLVLSPNASTADMVEACERLAVLVTRAPRDAKLLAFWAIAMWQTNVAENRARAQEIKKDYQAMVAATKVRPAQERMAQLLDLIPDLV